ncbi:hypothetical protein IVB36_21490 [Bradyrhizobium sp. 35]|uniref:hypothetical protein n=1 Tax=Bradyrhizobium sp. 35 TaxID=2782670 RepID=UPI001FFB063D|nr:hypothetical protein [Bradyrhizobium sp. 35]MCK1453381.1 hypothetical protein [Bradyrhizobium sp. 35]
MLRWFIRGGHIQNAIQQHEKSPPVFLHAAAMLRQFTAQNKTKPIVRGRAEDRAAPKLSSGSHDNDENTKADRNSRIR